MVTIRSSVSPSSLVQRDDANSRSYGIDRPIIDDAASRAPDVPRLAVNIRSTGLVTPHLSYQFFITLRREPDSHSEPCVLKWDPRREGFHHGHFDLIRESDGASDKICIEMPFHQQNRGSKEPIEVFPANRSRFHLHELPP
ncbi:hypothetical protein S40285_10419 [Stachybotrys chlorohalonatus IBT 40285]|uniref:Uncharacterized protein n=1 Tax=Stachybotrys chlorohalonatus (strain IBT 40285) TaxID=1283841 RepID=A0A084QEA3_STAC4|nr:hypothetical protein S40285_10419 [Stachybotrys chlorohalonata IBT 40285]